MLDQVVLIAGVTVFGVLEQAYFSLQVIYTRHKYLVSPPSTSGPPEFEWVFRAQLAPLYFCATFLWVLIGFSTLGILGSVCRFYLDLTQHCPRPHWSYEEREG